MTENMNETKIKIVGVQFKGAGKVYYFDPLDINFINSDWVVVETVRGLELGKVIIPVKEVPASEVEYELKPVIRKATEEDVENEKRNEELAPYSFEKFKKLVKKLDLDMKPLYCEYTIDSSKIIFYYCSEERVDFRELLKALTPEFKIRVELRQIGAREGARVLGGLGTCGRELCCKKYLQNFDFVTMKMAKEQSMSLNNSKISGACGKLLCCIAYEVELYKELRKEIPGIGTMVKTPTCNCCKVVGVDYIKKIVKTNENQDAMPVVHKACEVELINMARNTEKPERITSATQVNEEEIEIIDEELVVEEVKKSNNSNKNNKQKPKFEQKNKKDVVKEDKNISKENTSKENTSKEDTSKEDTSNENNLEVNKEEASTTTNQNKKEIKNKIYKKKKYRYGKKK